MSRLALVLAVLALSLSGCAVYGDDYAYPGYSTRYYETYPSYRVYYDDDDRNYYRWHRDRYEDRRHSHYAPGYDGRYQWHDGRYRDRQRAQIHQHSQQGWNQRYRVHERRDQSSWQHQGGQRHDGYSRERGKERARHQRGNGHEQLRESSHERGRRDDGRSWSISR